jgi:hypothetical protein
MEETMANEENLKPFQPGDARCYRGGRKKGSKNLSTILRQVLSMDAPKAMQKKKNLRGLLALSEGEQMSNVQAMAAQMIWRAVSKGDLAFINQVADRTEGKATRKIEFEGTVTNNILSELKEGILRAYDDVKRETDGDGDGSGAERF